MEWVEKLRHLFNDDFTATVEALTPGGATPREVKDTVESLKRIHEGMS